MLSTTYFRSKNLVFDIPSRKIMIEHIIIMLVFNRFRRYIPVPKQSQERFFAAAPTRQEFSPAQAGTARGTGAGTNGDWACARVFRK